MHLLYLVFFRGHLKNAINGLLTNVLCLCLQGEWWQAFRVVRWAMKSSPGPRVAREKPREGEERSCLLFIIESCNVFSKAKTDRSYPVHWTSILEEDCAKSALSFHEDARLWWKEIKEILLWPRESHPSFSFYFLLPPTFFSSFITAHREDCRNLVRPPLLSHLVLLFLFLVFKELGRGRDIMLRVGCLSCILTSPGLIPGTPLGPWAPPRMIPKCRPATLPWAQPCVPPNKTLQEKN